MTNGSLIPDDTDRHVQQLDLTDAVPVLGWATFPQRTLSETVAGYQLTPDDDAGIPRPSPCGYVPAVTLQPSCGWFSRAGLHFAS